MRCYRLQPQADSHVYRSVLMKKWKPGEKELEKRSDKNEDASCAGTIVKCNPGEMSGTSTIHDLEDRGDLIKFYNTVYIQRTQSFALRFSQQVRLQINILLQCSVIFINFESSCALLLINIFSTKLLYFCFRVIIYICLPFR